MKKFLVAMSATLVAISTAYAAEMEGVVQSVDMDTMMIMMEDGTSVKAAEGVDISGVEAGDKVMVMTDDGSGEATEVMVSE
jgi:opacity protein-like surface antigen